MLFQILSQVPQALGGQLMDGRVRRSRYRGDPFRNSSLHNSSTHDSSLHNSPTHIQSHSTKVTASPPLYLCQDWKFLQAYSPYHNISPNKGSVSYPPLLMTTSTLDDRVHPYHARCFVKRILDIQGSNNIAHDLSSKGANQCHISL